MPSCPNLADSLDMTALVAGVGGRAVVGVAVGKLHVSALPRHAMVEGCQHGRLRVRPLDNEHAVKLPQRVLGIGQILLVQHGVVVAVAGQVGERLAIRLWVG